MAVAGPGSDELERLGLTAERETAARKIAARHAAAPGNPNLTQLADLMLAASSAWLADPTAEVEVAELAWTLRHRRRMQVQYRSNCERHASSRIIDPYGRVAKSGRWYLIADDSSTGPMFTLEQLSGYTPLDATVALRSGRTSEPCGRR